MAPKDKYNKIFSPQAPQTALDRTTTEARLIIADHNQRRDELTASLKEARLAKEAAELAQGKPAPTKRKK
ncbi:MULTISPECIES: hypothetical protein [Paracoccus]|jgi:hypothetical protein|uniref:Uncharacterized protein n=1 Tax=Paracoccus litorisediminis TaxID=2006130 RepID=A0A844HPP1_9RHOB|nr:MULTISPECIES: hypothetical protein [Paracoccus]MBD9527738.1 hypothetical protein [Paracoccus sp. PAR01]MTH60374.1 hypothetical protein [Paracoccus litorisediminis]